MKVKNGVLVLAVVMVLAGGALAQEKGFCGTAASGLP